MINERLELFKRFYKTEITIQHIDLFSKYGKSGTRVIILIELDKKLINLKNTVYL